MLIACNECGHQYDAGDLPVGSKFLCHCGIYLRVPTVRAREAIIAHCSSCGGHLENDAKSCGFCGSEVAAVDRNLGPICPHCYSRMLKGASFCSSCGVAIRAETLHSGATELDCPRCRTPMMKRRVHHGSFAECFDCGGIWLGDEFFEGIVQERDREAVGAAIVAQSKHDLSGSLPEIDQVRYVPCPVCQQLMNRKNFAEISGVIIDWCKGHGYWFDAFELEQILAFVSSGGLDRSRTRQLDQARRRAEAAAKRAASSAPDMSGSVLIEGFEPRRDIGPSGAEILESVIEFIGGLFKRR
ncbi:MAG: zf-TFIIB domain-containing protein [Planctomycetes bacterium]|nr:zf-TFIIB domain-containing protein [Planctomycetota bacterium]